VNGLLYLVAALLIVRYIWLAVDPAQF